MQSPFILSVVAPTGSGKTFSTTLLLGGFKSGLFPLTHRFDTQHGDKHGEPFKFRRVIYIGQMDENSFDQHHNDGVQTIIGSGLDKGEAVTPEILAARAQIALQSPEIQRRDYAGLLKAPKGVDLIPEYINSFEDPSSMLFVIDDMSPILSIMSKSAQADLKKIFSVGSHHKGLSIIFLYQNIPQGPLGEHLFQASHYMMFPQLPREYGGGSINSSISIGNFRTVMNMISGFNRVALEEYTKLVEDSPTPPNFVIYNKRKLMTDAMLANNNSVGEDEPLHPRKKREKKT